MKSMEILTTPVIKPFETLSPSRRRGLSSPSNTKRRGFFFGSRSVKGFIVVRAWVDLRILS